MYLTLLNVVILFLVYLNFVLSFNGPLYESCMFCCSVSCVIVSKLDSHAYGDFQKLTRLHLGFSSRWKWKKHSYISYLRFCLYATLVPFPSDIWNHWWSLHIHGMTIVHANLELNWCSCKWRAKVKSRCLYSNQWAQVRKVW